MRTLRTLTTRVEHEWPTAICGIVTGRDVIEFLLAGASAVQVYTVLMREGMEAFSRILRELTQYMEKRGVYNVRDIVGAAREGRTGEEE